MTSPAPATAVVACALPDRSLLTKYTASGAFADCYTATLAREATQSEYVEAFYTGGAIRIERLLIGWFLRRPSSLAQVRQLAAGGTDDFAAWRVEARTPNQLLLCDVSGRTRSWLMTEAENGGTRLYFGSAVVPRVDRATGRTTMGPLFGALLGFHKLYSRLLLTAARSRLERRPTGASG